MVVADFNYAGTKDTVELISKLHTTPRGVINAVPFKCDVRSSQDCLNLVLRADELANENGCGVAEVLVNVAGITKVSALLRLHVLHSIFVMRL